MGEHIGRYTELIDALVSAGLTVYGNDHRGHGRTAATNGEFGDFGPAGFCALVADMAHLSRIARRENPGLPFILFGHSMGSFAAQQYVLDHSSQIDGLILSGSGDLDELARLARSAPQGTNVLNASFEPARTPFDWLSRDKEVVDTFMRDQLCFAELNPEANASFLAAASRLANPASLRQIREDLALYIFSGTDDPVGQNLVGLHTLLDRYLKAGIYDITYDFYAGGRHEMLNETNRSEVRANLLRWIGDLLQEKSSRETRRQDL
jgi:alpha-beta hydrolase superfamily lysophospholipase